MKRLVSLIAGFALAVVPFAGAQDKGKLDIYFVDVEGGQATLFVAPDHESLLVDTGWGGHDSRDAKRIVQVAKLAGLTKIDYAIITHYHDDHIGGVPQLLALIPVGTFIDHGELYEKCKTCVSGFDDYVKLVKEGKTKRMSVKAGQVLPFRAMNVQVVSSDMHVIDKPLAGAGAKNEFCAASEVRPDDTTENGHSVGVVLSFGKFRASDLGDLTWDMERKLMCPANKIGDISLMVVSHHGWYQSSSPAYIAAVHAKAAVMDNGQTKGGSLPTLENFNKVQGLQLWQLHYSDEGKSANAPEDRIANLDGSSDGHYIKVTASRDGSFTVFNERSGKTVSYPAR